MAADPAKRGENSFAIMVPKLPESKRFSIMKFGGSLGVEVTNWVNADNYQIYLDRENSKQVAAMHAAMEQRELQSGEGSVYGAASRMEMKRKKFGRQKRTYSVDNHAWLLSIEGKEERKLRGMKERGAGEHSDYWVFMKAGDRVFNAFKIDDWYQFTPCPNYKTLDAEEAEKQFLTRNKVLNQFAMKARIHSLIDRDEGGDDAGGGTSGTAKSDRIKITDDDDYKSDASDDSKVADADADPNGKSAKKKAKDKKQILKKKKKAANRFDDDVAPMESDDGDDEDREVDYMSSDSADDSDIGGAEAEARVEKELVGVDAEKGLRKMFDGPIDNDEDDEDDDEDDDDDDESSSSSADEVGEQRKSNVDVKEALKETRRRINKRLKTAEEEEELVEEKPPSPPDSRFADKEPDTDSGSESDDPDQEGFKSALFLKGKVGSVKKENGGSANGGVKIGASDAGAMPSTSSSSASTRKRAATPTKVDDKANTKKVKLESASRTFETGLNVETVRKYLERKPYSTKQLLNKFNALNLGMDKNELVKKLAEILKKINPKKEKKYINKKEVLFFSL